MMFCLFHFTRKLLFEKNEETRHIFFFFWTTAAMLKSVSSFKRYAEVESLGDVLKTCVSAMEGGLLHVDATNSYGWTLGYMFLENSTIFDKCLWDRYWALHPNLSLFWSLVHRHVQTLCINRHICIMLYLGEGLRNTSALWADLALVQPVAHRCLFIQEQVDKRGACRFAWIAAVVQQ
jgi:hypothetical protein